MTQDASNKGICSNCNFASTCRHSLSGVQFCEEYEIADSIKRFEGRRLDTNKAGLLKINPQTTASQFPDCVMGLCINCLHRETCGLPRPESGVWHCEEYE